jgi:hypothetical protein
VLRPRDEVVAPFEAERLRALDEGQRARFGRRDADERDLLDVGAVGVARLESEIAELGFDVGDREVLAAGSGGASFELVRRQDLDVLQHRFRIDLRHGRDRDGRRGWRVSLGGSGRLRRNG